MLFLNKVFSLFKLNKTEFLFTILVVIIIPNITLFIICFYLGINRSSINVDYLLPIILISIFRFKYSNLLFFIIFLLVFFIDILLISLQVFPFIKLSDILYLSSFIFTGPLIYRVYLVFFIFLLIIELLVITKITKHIHIKTRNFIFTILTICFLQLIQNSYYYSINRDITNFLSNSSILFLINNHDTNFFKLKNLHPLEPIKYPNASKPWYEKLNKNEKLNSKLLLVINESWGVPNDLQIQEATLAKLKSNAAIFDYFKQGNFNTIGATLAGELRELCALEPQILDLSKVNNGFENCLPNILKTQGYYSIAIHGTESLSLYNRDHWYPLAGFNSLLFEKQLNLPKDPGAPFGAISDIDLIPLIAKSFKEHDKIFYYWMTITTHAPYSQLSVRNKRFSCEIFNLTNNTETCNNLILQTQFFDTLAELVQKPEMRGVEVIVVGDHSPPLIGFKEGIRVFSPSKVSWIHFKIIQ